MDKKGIAKYIVADALRTIAGGVVLFLCAGRIDWWPGWAALGVFAGSELAIGIVGIRIHPNLLAERVGARMGDKPWDLAIYFMIRVGALAFFILGGLDQRYGWTAGFPAGFQIAGLAVCILGYALFVWATASNMFFSVMVRIQRERGQTVAAGGPYRFVRHPGYVGMILSELSFPFLLASWWVLIPGVICAAGLIIRTALEDRMLQGELPGYTEYAQRVRYRLLPGIW